MRCLKGFCFANRDGCVNCCSFVEVPHSPVLHLVLASSYPVLNKSFAVEQLCKYICISTNTDKCRSLQRIGHKLLKLINPVEVSELALKQTRCANPRREFVAR